MISFLRCFATAGTLLVLPACSSSGTDAPPPAISSMHWAADGVAIQATTVTVSAPRPSDGRLTIAGERGTGADARAITMQLPSQEGTYDLALPSPPAPLVFYTEGSAGTRIAYAPKAGSITVSSFSATNISGTFRFTGSTSPLASPDKEITSGAFTVYR
ncbi:DUF6252 family protein [Hymenobacter rubidus]|uniref:DUF6252 family protein n=1 Tax=Hymenobacter rubidus TaxID=1441626 RepID=UPI00191F502F|nr:DUF6252 family protein [Hymenobacter rubidus]